LVADPQIENNILQFIYTDPQTELERMIGGFHHINAFDKIEPGDDEKFKKFLEVAAPPTRTTIYINSTGGNVEAALGIGRPIREGWFSTSIGSYHISGASSEIPMFERKFLAGKCYSAATLIYLGGRLAAVPSRANQLVLNFAVLNARKEIGPVDLDCASVVQTNFPLPRRPALN
jgi:hypothetical protein